MKTKYFYTFLVVVMALFVPVITHAQVNPPPDPVDTPIDGGLSILLAAGVGYGVKKAYEKRKNKNNEVKDVEK